jgi:hypothetical protein
MSNPPAPIAPIPYAVTLADGTVDKFAIKPLVISKLYEWLCLAANQHEPAMVALATGKDIGWVDGLDVDTYAKLAGKCNEVIFPQALRLAKAAPTAAALVAPLIQKQVAGLRVVTILSAGSGNSSPTQPLSESAPSSSGKGQINE